MASKSLKTKFVTGKVRFSYANVFTPGETPNGTLKYSVSILIPKSDADTVNRFKKAFEETKTANAAVWGGSIPKTLKGGLRDGDAEKDDPAYAGHYFINASSNEKPGIVDADLNPIIDTSEFTLVAMVAHQSHCIHTIQAALRGLQQDLTTYRS